MASSPSLACGVEPSGSTWVRTTAARFVQMGAVVEPARAQRGPQVGHERGQLHGLDVVEAEFLEARRVDQGGAVRRSSTQYQVVLVVVCLPELRAREISPVRRPHRAPAG
jgi:hypothetical protein